jgi:hypothetical protein
LRFETCQTRHAVPSISSPRRDCRPPRGGRLQARRLSLAAIRPCRDGKPRGRRRASPGLPATRHDDRAKCSARSGLRTAAKFPLAPSGKSPLALRPVSRPIRGALRIVTNVGSAGCDGRGGVTRRVTSAADVRRDDIWGGRAVGRRWRSGRIVVTLIPARLRRASGAIYPRGLIDPLGNCPWPGPWIRTYGAHLLS